MQLDCVAVWRKGWLASASPDTASKTLMACGARHQPGTALEQGYAMVARKAKRAANGNKKPRIRGVS